jgi:hypothetical protein
MSGNTVTMTSSTGLCSLTADQGGNSTYNPASQATQNTTAQKATATVTLTNLTQVYTGTALTPTATTSPAGLSVAWTGAPQTAPGSYSVTASVTDPNYQGSASGTFTITTPSGAATITGVVVGHRSGAVDVQLKNIGAGTATNVSVANVVLRVTTGTGQITEVSWVPASAITLLPGQTSPTISVTFTVTGNISRYSIAESGTYSDTAPRSFSVSQAVFFP